MGISVPMISSMLLTFITIISMSFSFLIFVEWFELMSMINECERHYKDELNTLLTINIVAIGSNEVNVTVRNIGSKTVFLRRSSFSWCSLIVSYRDENGTWRSFLSDDYEIITIRIVDSNVFFNVSEHQYISPNEEALFKITVPSNYPPIPSNSVVVVAFASHNGAYAISRGVRSE